MQWVTAFLDKNRFNVGITRFTLILYSRQPLILNSVHGELIISGVSAAVTIFGTDSKHHRWLNTNLSFLYSFET